MVVNEIKKNLAVALFLENNLAAINIILAFFKINIHAIAYLLF